MSKFSPISDPLNGTFPPGNNTAGFVIGVNDNGDYVGGYWNNAIQTQSLFIYKDGTYTLLNNPLTIQNSSTTTGIWASEINTSDKIVGNIFGTVNNTPVSHGFIYSNNKFSQFDHPLASTTATYTIKGVGSIPDFTTSGTNLTGTNDAGQLVGNYVDASGKMHGFTYINNTFATLDHPSGVGKTTANDINNKGQVIGSYFDASGKSHGYIFENGQYTTIDHPNGFSINLTEFNDAGMILGSYIDASNKINGLFYESGSFVSIPTFPDANGFVGGGINNKGQIAGSYFTGDPSKGTAVFHNYETQIYDISSVSQSAISDSTYLLYQASFARMPDEGGFKYWADQAAVNKLSFNQVANAFMSSPEFKSVFGANPSNSDYVIKLYNNVLGRDPDASGAQFWTKQLDSGVARDTVLVGFALSPENVSGTASHMAGGYWVL